MKKTVIEDNVYSDGIKSIIHRHFFPDLKKSYDNDATFQAHDLDTFSSNYISKNACTFHSSIEHDRIKLREAAPKALLHTLHEPENLPYPAVPNASFFTHPQMITDQSSKPINHHFEPYINYHMTHVPTEHNKKLAIYSETGLPNLPSSSSTSDTDSEIEGRTPIRRETISKYSTIAAIKERQEKKKIEELSRRGNELLGALRKN